MTTDNSEITPGGTDMLASPHADATAPSSAPPAGSGAGSFAGDETARSVPEAVRGYVNRVRGGEVGALPAVIGLVALLVVFTIASKFFLTRGNLANEMNQAAKFIVLAMGLVFVLLLGEIDLSAGTASGVCAAAMGLALVHNGNLHEALGTTTYVLLLLAMAAAAVVTAMARLWVPFALIAAGVVVALTGIGSNALLAILLAIAVGTSIGTLIGVLVARVGIPSFVVTLALFLAWQGVLLKFIGLGSAISTRKFDVINAIANKNVPVGVGWLMYAVAILAYTGLTVSRAIRRNRANLTAEPVSLAVARALVLAAIGGFIVWFLNGERSPNPATISIKGMPYTMPIVVVLLIGLTVFLGRTAFGRHLYAVGGNAEAARRAGIDVRRMRLAAFTICSSLAAISGVIAASEIGSVPADAGGGNRLLYGVAAAVIGGTSLFGGRGRVRDAVIGGFVIGLIPNGLGLLNLNSTYEFMITGVVLLIAASIDSLGRRRARASGR